MRFISYDCANSNHAKCYHCDCTCHDEYLLEHLLFDEIENIHNQTMMNDAFDRYPEELDSEIEFAIDSATDEELGFDPLEVYDGTQENWTEYEPEVDYDAGSCMPIPHEPHSEYLYSCPGFIGPEIYRLSEEYQGKLEGSEY